MSAPLNVFGFKEGYDMNDVRNTAEVFVRIPDDVLGDEEFLVKPLREFGARTAEGFFEEAFSFAVRFWGSSDLPARELVLLAAYIARGPAYAKGGAALGAGPRVASMLSTLRLPGFVGFHAEVLG